MVSTIAVALILCGQLSPTLAAPRPKVKPVSLAVVQQLKAPLTIEAVEKAFGPAVGQPGPRVSYPSADHKGMSFWLWIEAPNQRDLSKTAAQVVGCIILATTTSEEKQQVVWPLDAVNEPPAKLIERVNETYARSK
jgi:hypothetical protein